MTKTLTLKSILKKHNSIAWYPSSSLDFMFANLLTNHMPKFIENSQDMPDCILMTDIYGENYRYLLNLSNGDELETYNKDITIRIYNVTKLSKINIKYDPKYFDLFGKDIDYGKSLFAKLELFFNNKIKEINLIFVCVENITFAMDYLVKNNIYIKYVIEYNWGMGSEYYAYLPYIYKFMNSKYYISSIDYDNYDVYIDYDKLLDIFKCDCNEIKKLKIKKIYKFDYSTMYDIYLFIFDSENDINGGKL